MYLILHLNTEDDYQNLSEDPDDQIHHVLGVAGAPGRVLHHQQRDAHRDVDEEINFEDSALHLINEDGEDREDDDLVDGGDQNGPSSPQLEPQPLQIISHWIYFTSVSNLKHY